MNTVYGSFSIMPYHIFGRKQIDILLSPLFERLKNSMQSFVLIFHFFGSGSIKTGMSKYRILHKEYGRIRMFATDNRIELISTFLYLLHTGIRNKILYKYRSIHTRYHMRYL